MKNPPYLRHLSIFILLGIVGVCVSFAQHEDEFQDPEIQIVPLDRDLPTSELKQPGYRVHSLSERAKQKQIPRPVVREEIFAEAGVSPLIGDWDHFDRDRLLVRARSSSLQTLQKHYPELPLEVLKKLQAAVGEGQ